MPGASNYPGRQPCIQSEYIIQVNYVYTIYIMSAVYNVSRKYRIRGVFRNNSRVNIYERHASPGDNYAK